jgi:DNA-binding response OmpR family regulator
MIRTDIGARVLLVDDDVALCSLLEERLRTEDFLLESVHDGIRGLQRARSGEHAIVILDLMLPGMSGLDVLRQLRSSSRIPVIILTARGDEIDRILGLEIGADDYLSKPFSPRELVARLRAVLRRALASGAPTQTIEIAGFSLNSAAREAWLDGAKLGLTGVEFSLLEILLQNAGRIVSREQLTEAVLSRKLGPFDRVIDVHVSNLRKKLGISKDGERIKAVRGSGYLLVVRPDPTHGFPRA